MLGQIIEIATPKCHVAKDRGFLTVSHQGDIKGKVPLDDILGIMVTGHGCTHSSNLITACSERGIAFVICGSNFTPSAYMLPTNGNTYQSERFRQQIAMKETAKNQLWKQVVRAKINSQAWALETIGQIDGANVLRDYSRRVKSGDTSNVEGTTSARYWRYMMGNDFRRDQSAMGGNSLLNYGYAVVRSTVARAVCATGLHPTIGIHHKNRTNPMCLVDDLMEPFRPIVDITVHHLQERGYDQIDATTKSVLSNITALDMPSDKGVAPLFKVVTTYTKNLVHVMAGDCKTLTPPIMPDKIAICSLYANILD